MVHLLVNDALAQRIGLLSARFGEGVHAFPLFSTRDVPLCDVQEAVFLHPLECSRYVFPLNVNSCGYTCLRERCWGFPPTARQLLVDEMQKRTFLSREGS